MYQTDIQSIICSFTIIGVTLNIFTFFLIPYFDNNDAAALSILLTADIVLTLYRILSLIQHGSIDGLGSTNFFQPINYQFLLPALFSLSFLLSFAAIVKKRQILLSTSNIVAIITSIILLPIFIKVATNTGTSAINAHQTTMVMSSFIYLLSAIAVWPLTKKNNAAKALFLILLWQFIESIALVPFVAINPEFVYAGNQAEFQSFFPTISQFVAEFSRTLAFVMMLNECKYAALKIKSDDGDTLIAGSRPLMTNKNEVLVQDMISHPSFESDKLQSEAEFYLLANKVNSHVVRHDSTGRIIYSNQRYLDLMGMNESDVVGHYPEEIYADKKFTDMHKVEAACKYVTETCESIQLDISVPSASGDYQLHRINFIPELDSKGQFRNVLAVGDDITQQKQLEDNLREQERKYRTLIDNFPYLIVRYDMAFRRTYANKTYAEIIGLALDQVLNKSIDEIWSIDKHISVAQFKRFLKRVIKQKQPENFFIQWEMPNGELTSREVYIVPEFNDHGDVVSVLCIGHETNMYKKAIHELGELNTQLQELVERRESDREEERKHIAQEIHDDLGQLISLFRLHASMIETEYGESIPDLGSRANKMIEISDQATSSVRNLITKLRPAMFDHGFIYALECLAADFYINTDINCTLDIPQAKDSKIHEPLIEENRALMIFRIVQEALTNVMRHSEASIVSIYLLIEADYLLLKVSDNGVGFNTEADLRDKAFGLKGMYERIKVLQGNLEIISNIGKGTEIRIHAPIKTKTNSISRTNSINNGNAIK